MLCSNRSFSSIADVHCPTLSVTEPPLIAKIEGPRLGESATFECPHGYRLEGASSMTCQYNGEYIYINMCVCVRARTPTDLYFSLSVVREREGTGWSAGIDWSARAQSSREIARGLIREARATKREAESFRLLGVLRVRCGRRNRGEILSEMYRRKVKLWICFGHF